MPNHVKTELKITNATGKVVTQEVLRNYTNDEGHLDFNTIILMPTDLNITKATYPSGVENPQAEQEKRNIANYGHATWYGWRLENWGTKWNAYDGDNVEHIDDVYRFETAWSVASEVLTELSKLNPTLKIEVWYADEDLGCNCGEFVLLDGVKLSSNIAPNYRDQTKEDEAYWTEFAFTLYYPEEDPASWGYGPDWVYSDDVYEANK